MCGVQSALLALDFAWPLHFAAVFWLGGVGLLTLPWAYLVLRAPGAERDSFRQTLGVRLAVVGLAMGFLAARGWVFLASRGLDPAYFVGSARSYSVAVMAVLLLGPLASGSWIARLARQVADHPSRSLAASFAGAGLFGTFLLSLPLSMHRVSELSFIDNLFMAFSAVCITGLSVSTLAETYTEFGQLVLCVLVQVGGIGIMVLSSAIAMLIGQRMRVRSRVALAHVVDTNSLAGLRRTVSSIVHPACDRSTFCAKRTRRGLAPRVSASFDMWMACAWCAIIPCMKRTSASVKSAPGGIATGGSPAPCASWPIAA